MLENISGRTVFAKSKAIPGEMPLEEMARMNALIQTVKFHQVAELSVYLNRMFKEYKISPLQPTHQSFSVLIFRF